MRTDGLAVGLQNAAYDRQAREGRRACDRDRPARLDEDRLEVGLRWLRLGLGAVDVGCHGSTVGVDRVRAADLSAVSGWGRQVVFFPLGRARWWPDLALGAGWGLAWRGAAVRHAAPVRAPGRPRRTACVTSHGRRWRATVTQAEDEGGSRSGSCDALAVAEPGPIPRRHHGPGGASGHAFYSALACGACRRSGSRHRPPGARTAGGGLLARCDPATPATGDGGSSWSPPTAVLSSEEPPLRVDAATNPDVVAVGIGQRELVHPPRHVLDGGHREARRPQVSRASRLRRARSCSTPAPLVAGSTAEFRLRLKALLFVQFREARTRRRNAPRRTRRARRTGSTRPCPPPAKWASRRCPLPEAATTRCRSGTA